MAVEFQLSFEVAHRSRCKDLVRRDAHSVDFDFAAAAQSGPGVSCQFLPHARTATGAPENKLAADQLRQFPRARSVRDTEARSGRQALNAWPKQQRDRPNSGASSACAT